MKQRARISCPGVVVSPPATLASAEHAEAGEQHALATEAVREAAGGEQQGGEHEVVGVDDPLQLAVGRVQLTHQRRQRDVDDRRVEVDREGREQERDEDQRPAAHAIEPSASADAAQLIRARIDASGPPTVSAPQPRPLVRVVAVLIDIPIRAARVPDGACERGAQLPVEVRGGATCDLDLARVRSLRALAARRSRGLLRPRSHI